MGIIKVIVPCRISLAGGGTDVSPYKDLFSGATVSLAINIRQTFTLYSGEDIWKHKGEHVVPYGCSLDFVYAFRKRFGVDGMHHNKFKSESDGGINAGLGSSAAIGVAIVAALAKDKGQALTRSEIAELAWDIENNDLKMFSGRQDHYASAYGGLNLFEFTDKDVKISPFDRKYAEGILPGLVLFHTNITRVNPKIQEGMKSLDDKQKKALDQVKSLVAPTIEAIGQGDIQILGEIIDTAWKFKKESNKGITTPKIDGIYNTAKKNGAIGAKLCGSGGGGCMLFVVKPEQRDTFIKKMVDAGLEHCDFGLDETGVDVRIV